MIKFQVNACGQCPETEIINNGYCTLDNEECGNEAETSYLLRHLDEKTCDDGKQPDVEQVNNIYESNEKSTTNVVEQQTETDQSTDESLGDEDKTSESDDVAENDEWENLSKEEKDAKTKEYCLERICNTYQRVVDDKVSACFVETGNYYNGRILAHLARGAANEYLDEAVNVALNEIDDDEIKDEIFDMKDNFETDFDDVYGKYFEYFGERDANEIDAWFEKDGAILLKGYKECCLKFFHEAEKTLAKHNITMNIAKLAKALPF